MASSKALLVLLVAVAIIHASLLAEAAVTEHEEELSPEESAATRTSGKFLGQVVEEKGKAGDSKAICCRRCCYSVGGYCRRCCPGWIVILPYCCPRCCALDPYGRCLRCCY